MNVLDTKLIKKNTEIISRYLTQEDDLVQKESDFHLTKDSVKYLSLYLIGSNKYKFQNNYDELGREIKKKKDLERWKNLKLSCWDQLSY